MRNGIQLLLIGALLLTLTATAEIASQTAEAAIVARKCRCGKATCRECRPLRKKRPRRRLCRKCPKCQHDVCELKAECVKEERLCFEVEQKVICIPTISWPWTKCRCNNAPCCNDCDCLCRCKCRCGKTKTVKVLIPKFYECPSCKYKWNVLEPDLPQPCDSPNNYVEPDDALPSDAQQPEFERNELYDPRGSDIPTPPPGNRINNQ